MAAAGEATQPLKYKTWVLKVHIHCVGCKREVKKVLQNIEGVYSTSIDAQQQKITVSGNIDAETIIKKLLKTGKHAEIWNDKSAQKGKKNGKQNDPKSCQNKQQPTSGEAKLNSSNPLDSETPAKKDIVEVTSGKKRIESVPRAAADKGNAENCGKKKKGKGQNGHSACDQANVAPTSAALLNANQEICEEANRINLSPTFEQFSSIQGPPAVHVMSYDAAHPSKCALSYEVPSSPFISCNTNEQARNYQVQSAAINSFNFFSDENPNGCSVM